MVMEQERLDANDGSSVEVRGLGKCKSRKEITVQAVVFALLERAEREAEGDPKAAGWERERGGRHYDQCGFILTKFTL